MARPLRFSVNTTLDGCTDHLAGIPSIDLHEDAARRIAEADALILGRVTYEMMESAWREPGRTGVPAEWMEPWMLPFARTIDAAKKYVVSTTLERVDWNAELVQGDLRTAISELVRRPGRGLMLGGVALAQSLAELDLIDEYEFLVHPRIAGHGPTLFGGFSRHLDLRLAGVRELPSGIVALRYERAREPR
ncbi:MAG: dihydrofolate reductase family protein [Planctomycetota bacterium]